MSRIAFLFAVGLIAGCDQVFAQPWPTRTVTIVSGFSPGGIIDAAIRPVAQELSAKLGAQFVLEHRVGAGGSLAAQNVARSDPDGYTLLIATSGQMVLTKLINKAAPFDPIADFTPIALLAEVPQVIVSPHDRTYNTLGELIEYARKNPGKLTAGHSGPGTTGHLASVLFAHRTGTSPIFVAYRGVAPMVPDLLNGQLDVGFPTLIPALKSLKLLAVTSEKRLSDLPHVPTAREAGLDLVATTWLALYGPRGLPADIVEKIGTLAVSFVGSAATREQFAQSGIEPLPGNADELRRRVADDTAKWSPIIESANIKVDP